MRARVMGIARHFGVELECYLPTGVTRSTVEREFTAAGLIVGRGISAWTIKGDGSLNSPPRRGFQGMEVTSPKLSGDNGLAQVETATRILRNLGCEVNRSCGTHVHHDAADLTVDQIKRVARGWANNQTIIDWFVAPSRRQQNTGYCRPVTTGDLSTLDTATTLEQIRRLYLDRYRTLNLAAYGKFGTLEVRQHQGTLSFEKVRTWIMFGQAVIDTAIVGDIPQASTVRDLIAALGDRIDETARTFLFGRAAEFGAPIPATV
jgi:hypothetical protein